MALILTFFRLAIHDRRRVLPRAVDRCQWECALRKPRPPAMFFRRRPLLYAFASIMAVLVFVEGPPALAQDTAKVGVVLPDPLTSEAINALVSRLSDAEVRNLLLQELGARKVDAKPALIPKQTIVETLTTVAFTLVDHTVTAIKTAPENARATLSALRAYLTGLGPSGALKLGLSIIAAFCAGLAIDLIYWRFLLAGPSRRGRSFAAVPDFPASIPYLARHWIREAGGALLALAAAAAVLALTLPLREARIGMTVVLWVWFVPRLTYITLKFFLSPQQADCRLVATDDSTARVLTYNLVGMLVVVGLIETILRVVAETGAAEAALKAGFWANLLVFSWLAVLVVVCRSGLQSILRARDAAITGWESRLIAAYPTLAVLAIFLVWIAGTAAGLFGKEQVVREGRHIVSLVLILVAPMFDTAIRAGVHILVPPLRGTGPDAVEAYAAASRSYVRIARVIVFGGVVAAIAALWDVSIFGPVGDTDSLFSGVYLEALLILLCGFVALELTSVFFNRKLADEIADDPAGLPGEMDDGPSVHGASSRLGTILPPMSWALQGAILVVTALMALGHVGVNVTALLAGAGVIGIAVGFGAQKLVADVVSGLFFLIDDAFRINEYIEAGGMQGTVEKIALRSLSLRKSDGALHCVPYSAVDAITNFARDWGTMKQVFTVPFDTDIEKVRKIFKKIGADLLVVPEYKDAFLQPFKFKGVNQVNDVGIVIRGKFMFKPEKAMQFLIQREIYKRVQAEFAAGGIEFARREVHVNVDRHSDDPDGISDEVATAAAAEAVAASNVAPLKGSPN